MFRDLETEWEEWSLWAYEEIRNANLSTSEACMVIRGGIAMIKAIRKDISRTKEVIHAQKNHSIKGDRFA